MSEDRDLRAALESLAATDRQRFEGDLSDEELVSYVAGDLDAEAEDRVQAYLTASGPARARLLALRQGAGLEVPSDDDVPVKPLSSDQKAEDLRRIRARLGIDVPVEKAQVAQVSAEVLPYPRRSASPRGPGVAISSFGLRAAAVLTCTVLGGALLFALLQIGAKNGALSAKTEPAGFVDVRWLERDGTTRGPTGPAAEVGAERARILFQLEAVPSHFAEPANPYRYRVEIVERSPNNPMVWSQDGFQAEADGTFHLLLDRDFLRAGQYQIRLFGARGGAAPQKLATYTFDL